MTFDAKDPDTKFPPIEPLRPPDGAPNVLIVLLDDIGFGAASAFGGPCNTPVAERLMAPTDQPAGNARCETLEPEEYEQGDRADCKRDDTRRPQVRDDMRELPDRVAVTFVDAEELGKLADGHEDRQPEDEARHDRPGQELGDEAEPEQSGEDEKAPGEKDHAAHERGIVAGFPGCNSVTAEKTSTADAEVPATTS